MPLADQTTAEIHALLRDRPGRPLASLLNSDDVRVDVGRRHIFRDSFWKGSFARDTALGKFENPGFGAPAPGFAQGSFWKRFDRIEDGVCRGHVVNFEMHSLPGEPEVRERNYPDGRRAYFAAGAPFLLLNYRNDPYRIVYDTIKTIDGDNAVGVMHLGTFPKGIEFAAFFMERHNYPFRKMTASDFRLLSADPAAEPARAAGVEGRWEGTLLSLTDPNRVLLNQVNPHRLRVTIERKADRLRVRYRIGAAKGADVVDDAEVIDLAGENEELFEAAAIGNSVFHLGADAKGKDALAGRWISSSTRLLEAPGMAQYAEPADDGFAFHFYVERVESR